MCMLESNQDAGSIPVDSSAGSNPVLSAINILQLKRKMKKINKEIIKLTSRKKEIESKIKSLKALKRRHAKVAGQN